MIPKFLDPGYLTIEREIDGSKQMEDIRHARTYLQNIITKVYV